MDEIHQAPYFGHLGYHKTIAIAKMKYFWLGMKRTWMDVIQGA